MQSIKIVKLPAIFEKIMQTRQSSPFKTEQSPKEIRNISTADLQRQEFIYKRTFYKNENSSNIFH